MVEAEAGYGPELMGRRIRIGEGLAGVAADSGEPVLANSVVMQGGAIRVGVDRHRRDAHFAAGPHHSYRNLSAVRNEYLLEHDSGEALPTRSAAAPAGNNKGLSGLRRGHFLQDARVRGCPKLPTGCSGPS